ncbi:hypothetical protein SLEP1_g14879 [Rubroshorea leprosula]|uniref:Uncharacterized protein n=1 Tax=Rubroshorea leprosula TaxID=152421 RepID=A0AAV5IW11_9ROSI|nr:hypothetical protein SLEP1_g14879 [Rubroshorea leprosula]
MKSKGVKCRGGNGNNTEALDLGNMKKSSPFLVRQFGGGSGSDQFSKESNNL